MVVLLVLLLLLLLDAALIAWFYPFHRYFSIIMPRMSGKDYIYMSIKIIGVVMLLLVLPWPSLLVSLVVSLHLQVECKYTLSFSFTAHSAHFHLSRFQCKRVHTFQLPHIVCQCHFKSQSIPLHSILANV